MATQYYSRSRSRPLSERGLRAEALLRRFPDLNAGELDSLIEIFPRLPYLDLALMSDDAGLAERISAFHEAHERDLSAPMAALIGFMIAFGLVPAAMVVGLIWWVM